MKLRTVPHLIGQGCVSFWRNRVMSSAAILILICCMLVSGAFYMVVDNLNVFLDSEIDTFKTVVVYVYAPLEQEELDRIDAEFDGLMKKPSSNIVSIDHVSKEEGLDEWEKWEEENGGKIAPILHELKEKGINDLPEKYCVKFARFSEVPKLLRELEEKLKTVIETAEENPNGDSSYEIREVGVESYKKLKTIRSAAAAGGIVLMLMLLAFGVLVIMNTVKLTVYARRRDIAVMRYIGATGSFVVSPFIVEGIIIGVIAAAIAAGLQFYLYKEVFAGIIKGYVNLVPAADYALSIPLMFLGIGLFAGIIASVVSVKMYSDV